MTHFVCNGDCNGVSETPGTCTTEGCAEHSHELHACDCTDQTHGKGSDQSESGE